MRRSKPTTLPIGTISEGTLRAEDLIPAYLAALGSIRLTKTERATVRLVQREFSAQLAEESVYSATFDDLNLIEDLIGILDNHCPPYTYFGTLEGDGAHFGVWISEDALREAKEDGEIIVDDGGGLTPEEYREATKHRRYLLCISDHGNMTLYKGWGSRHSSEVWSVV